MLISIAAVAGSLMPSWLEAMVSHGDVRVMERKVVQHTIDTPYLVGPVHSYCVEHGDDLVLFDTGPPTPEGIQWAKANIDLQRLKYVLVTHCHIDHYGLAHWFEENSGARILIPYRDALKMSHHDRRIELMWELLLSLGFSKTYLQRLREIFDSGALFPPFPKEYGIAENDIPPELGITALNCAGHSQSDLVYVFDDRAVTGDTLLKGIFQSPLLDVDLEVEKRFNNYHAYCNSITRLASLNGKTVLPGHRFSIESGLGAIRLYVTKLLQRVQQLHPYADEKNIAAIIDALFNGSMKDVFHIYLKASEILFMQDLLAEPERLRSSLVKIGIYDEIEELYENATGDR